MSIKKKNFIKEIVTNNDPRYSYNNEQLYVQEYLAKNELPFYKRFTSLEGTSYREVQRLIETVKKYHTTPKKISNFLSLWLTLPDITNNELYLNDKNMTKYMFDSKEVHGEFVKLCRTIKDNNVSFHNVCSNLPKYREDRALDVISFINKLVVSGNQHIFKYINMANYNRIRLAPSYEKMEQELDYINASIELKRINNNSRVNNSGNYGSNKAINFNGYEFLPFMLMKTTNYNDVRFKFSKAKADVTSIGSETLCCFRPGGLADSLLYIAIESPIAAIIKGYSNKLKWFTFIWELVEKNPTYYHYDINLIYDNIEANVIITDDEAGYILSKTKEIKEYKNIFLGTVRNDIMLPDSITKTIRDRPCIITGYKDKFNKYARSFDDSKYLYTLKHEEDINGVHDVHIKYANIGDILRMCYIMDDIDHYRSNKDINPKTHNPYEYPSIIISNNYGIYGYIYAERSKIGGCDIHVHEPIMLHNMDRDLLKSIVNDYINDLIKYGEFTNLELHEVYRSMVDIKNDNVHIVYRDLITSVNKNSGKKVTCNYTKDLDMLKFITSNPHMEETTSNTNTTNTTRLELSVPYDVVEDLDLYNKILKVELYKLVNDLIEEGIPKSYKFFNMKFNSAGNLELEDHDDISNISKIIEDSDLLENISNRYAVFKG